MPERPPAIAQSQFKKHRTLLEKLSMEDRFGYIFQKNIWAADTSASGLGSELDSTSAIRLALPALLQTFEIKTLLDAPCGDINWLAGAIDIEHYIGLDIVPEVIKQNEEQEIGRLTTRFEATNICDSALPMADLILCRDCLVHFSFENALAALKQFKRSGARFLLTTHFTDQQSNEDIVDGDWRPLNMTRSPFNFPPPERLINEVCKEMNGAYADKSLGLWELSVLECAD